MIFDRLKTFMHSQTTRLATSYLAVIMVMSLCFSLILYNVSVSELDRQIPGATIFDQPKSIDQIIIKNKLNNFLLERIEQSRQALVARLVLLNIFVFGAGALMSYYLARRTLRPIEANMEAQSQFVSDASHELRTPLTVLKTTNEVALRKKKLDEKTARALINDNIAEISKLQQLTDGLLLLARTDQQPLPLARSDITDVAIEAINTVLPLAQTKNITIQDSIPTLYIMADQTSLTRAIVILLDNAIKFSPEKSVIEFRAMKTDKAVEISVRDHGLGIAPKDLERIFDRFYRADEARDKQRASGYGIGLALAKKIIEQHHGSLTATSEVGKGSEFTIIIPSDN